jgi:hypothetical protein
MTSSVINRVEPDENDEEAVELLDYGYEDGQSPLSAHFVTHF